MRVGGPCHECAGTIVESRSDKFQVGQRVIVLPGAAGYRRAGGVHLRRPGPHGRAPRRG